MRAAKGNLTLNYILQNMQLFRNPQFYPYNFYQFFVYVGYQDFNFYRDVYRLIKA
jgi:hypothetical protein